jgi:hypothetical protein
MVYTLFLQRDERMKKPYLNPLLGRGLYWHVIKYQTPSPLESNSP